MFDFSSYKEYVEKRRKADVHIPVYTIVRDVICDEILTCGIPPGQRFKEEELALQMNISRTTVRKALKELEKRELIEISGLQGSRVTGISERRYRELFEFSRRLEPYAARLAARRRTMNDLDALASFIDCNDDITPQEYAHIDIGFHRAIFIASKNTYLLNAYDMISDDLFRYGYYYADDTVDRKTKRSMEEETHRQIYQAIRQSDETAAYNLAKEHFELVETETLRRQFIEQLK